MSHKSWREYNAGIGPLILGSAELVQSRVELDGRCYPDMVNPKGSFRCVPSWNGPLFL